MHPGTHRRRTGFRPLTAVGAVLGALTACSSSNPPISISITSQLPVPVTVRVDGNVVAHLERKWESKTVQLDLRDGKRPTAEARFATACGEVRLPVTLDERTHLTPRDFPDQFVADERDLALVVFHVDNRQRNARELSYGHLRKPLRGEVGLVNFPAARCGVAITLDGKPIGTLPPPVPSPSGVTHGHFIVDGSGQHCYVVKEIVYGGDGHERYKAPTVLTGGHLHAQKSVDYFLTEPPESIKSAFRANRHIHIADCASAGVSAAPPAKLPALSGAEARCKGEFCAKLGSRYTYPTKGRPDPARAMALYLRGCETGGRISCYMAATVVEMGRAVPADLARAAKLYQSSCDGGYVKACYPLGVLLKNGAQGLPIDYARSQAMFRRACDGKVTLACAALGELKLFP